jgi:hypothetical protein
MSLRRYEGGLVGIGETSGPLNSDIGSKLFRQSFTTNRIKEDEMKPSNRFGDWFDRYWTILVILFGIAFTLFLALFKPHNGWANY